MSFSVVSCLAVTGDENKTAACFGHRFASTQPHLTCRSNHSGDADCITCTGTVSLLSSVLPGAQNLHTVSITSITDQTKHCGILLKGI